MQSIDPRRLGKKRRGRHRKLDPNREAELCSGYTSGLPLRQLQKEFGLSKIGVYGVLKRYDIARTRANNGQAAEPEQGHQGGNL